MQQPPSIDDLKDAARRLDGVAHRTPVLTSSTLDGLTGARVFLKAECFQRMGAFKFRGAYNALATLDDDARRRGVVTHSSGNHGQAVALAARIFGVPAHVVMPKNAPTVKKDAVRGYGAQVVLCEPTMQAREAGAEAVIARTGARLVHPFDDPFIIAGQSTAAQELLQQVDESLDIVLVPVGGGGLASGTGLACAAFSPSTAVIGCEPAGADDAARSFAAGRRIQPETTRTVADGLRGQLSDLTFAVIHARLQSILRIEEQAILDAMFLVWNRLKILIEPSAAVAVAALFSSEIDFTGRKVGIILSGGNVDIEQVVCGEQRQPS